MFSSPGLSGHGTLAKDSNSDFSLSGLSTLLRGDGKASAGERSCGDRLYLAFSRALCGDEKEALWLTDLGEA